MTWIERIKSLFRGGRSAEPRASSTGDIPDSRAQITEELRGHMVEHSDGDLTLDMVDDAAPLFDAGYIDSLNSLTLIGFIEERYGVEVPEVELVGRLCSLDALAAHIHEHRGAAG